MYIFILMFMFKNIELLLSADYIYNKKKWLAGKSHGYYLKSSRLHEKQKYSAWIQHDFDLQADISGRHGCDLQIMFTFSDYGLNS